MRKFVKYIIPEAKQLLKQLEEAGYSAYLVGGAVRDLIMGKTPVDFDIATNARPEDIDKVFSDKNVKHIGKSFGVALVDGIEIATYRKDRYNGFDHKDVEITFSDTIEEDLERRDFTINTVALDLRGNVVDPFGGQEDIKTRTIRFVSDPEERIKEDPNRMLRACRFYCAIDGRIEEGTRDAICAHVRRYGIYGVAPDRVRTEILKALVCPKASLFFAALLDTGLLGFVLPSLAKCVDAPGGQYHSEDVFEHAMAVGDAIHPKFPLLKFVGYLHDVGKPKTWDGEHFPEHAHVGAALVRQEFESLVFSHNDVKKAETLVELHMRGFPKNRGTVNRLKKKLSDSGLTYQDYLRLKVADHAGNQKNKHFKISELKSKIRPFLKETPPFAVRDLEVSGDDVMVLLNIMPGPNVGRVLKTLHAHVLEHGVEANDRNELLAKIKTFSLSLP